jgi:hypothetical protein
VNVSNGDMSVRSVRIPGRRQSPGSILFPLLVFAVASWCSVGYAQVTVKMTAAPARITVNQTTVVRISVEASGAGSPQVVLPDFNGFDVVQRKVSRPMQFSFSFGTGARQQVFRSSTEYTFVLRSLSEGEFVIPPVEVALGNKTYRSKPVTIVVGSTGGAPSTAPGEETGQPASPAVTRPAGPQPVDGAIFDNQAFLRTVVDKAEAYVGEQVTVTVYLYIRGRLRSSPEVDTEPGTNGFWVQDLLPPDYRLDSRRQLVSGIPFHVYMLRRFAAFPLQSGDLSIDPMTVSIERRSMFDLFDMMNRGLPARISRTGIPVAVKAKELPDQGRGAGEVAVGRFEARAKLDRNQVPTGDAVTLTLTVRGQGDVRAVRPRSPETDGLRVLQPEIRDLLEAPDDLVGGTRVMEWLVVPTRPGRFTIGPIGFQAFDPAAEVYRSIRTETLTLTAVGKALETDPVQSPATEAEPSPERDSTEALSFGPIRTRSALTRRQTRIAGAEWYPWLVALGPVGWFFVLAAAAVRRRLAESAVRSAPRRAAREARKRLAGAEALIDGGDAAGFYAEVTAALTELLQARLGEAVGGYTLGQLRDRLVALGMSEELAGQTVEELQGCDLARFSSSGSSPAEMKRCVERNRELFGRLSAFSPVGAEE